MGMRDEKWRWMQIRAARSKQLLALKLCSSLSSGSGLPGWRANPPAPSTASDRGLLRSASSRRRCGALPSQDHPDSVQQPRPAKSSSLDLIHLNILCLQKLSPTDVSKGWSQGTTFLTLECPSLITRS